MMIDPRARRSEAGARGAIAHLSTRYTNLMQGFTRSGLVVELQYQERYLEAKLP